MEESPLRGLVKWICSVAGQSETQVSILGKQLRQIQPLRERDKKGFATL